MPTKPRPDAASKKSSVEIILRSLERVAFVPDLRRIATHEDGVDEDDGIALGEDDATRSKLGGAPYLSATVAHPLCGRCKEPLQLTVQLLRRDLPEPWQASVANDLLQAFWCGECHGNNEDAFSKGTLVREVSMAEPCTTRVVPGDEDTWSIVSFIGGWQPHPDFPSSLEDELRFMKVGAAIRNAILESPPDGEVLDGVKLSTWRRWTSAPAVFKCKCRLPMSWWLHLGELGPTIGDGRTLGVLSCTCGLKALQAD
jgi:hypothetical protein